MYSVCKTSLTKAYRLPSLLGAGVDRLPRVQSGDRLLHTEKKTHNESKSTGNKYRNTALSTERRPSSIIEHVL